ncbi:MAG: hypothetical protein IAE95_09185 [Chitinophagaceae bacterium]|nr:hypothetical protein [Chitinophagaceae bacterium]
MNLLRSYWFVLLLSGMAHVCLAQTMPYGVREGETIRDGWEYTDTVPDGKILFHKTVWRFLDTVSPVNKCMFSPQSPTCRPLAEVLLAGVSTGAIRAWSADDTLTSVLLSADSVKKLMTQFSAPGQSGNIPVLTGMSLREEWTFDRDTGEMRVNIRSLAPVFISPADGKEKKLFWISFPESAAYLDLHTTLVTVNSNGVALSWPQYFRSRQFSSRITRISPSIVPSGSEEVEEGKGRRRRRRH